MITKFVDRAAGTVITTDDKTPDQIALRTAYIQAVSDLTAIIATNPNADVRRIAEITRGILRYFKTEIEG